MSALNYSNTAVPLGVPPPWFLQDNDAESIAASDHSSIDGGEPVENPHDVDSNDPQEPEDPPDVPVAPERDDPPNAPANDPHDPS
jgi:hypothetical protein